MTDLISDFVWDDVCEDAYGLLDALEEDTVVGGTRELKIDEKYPDIIGMLMEEYPEIKNEDMAYQVFWNWKKGKKNNKLFVRCQVCNEIFTPKTNFNWCSYSCATGI